MHDFSLMHLGFVPDGAIIEFPHSAYVYMKVCGVNGNGAVVRLMNGLYLTKADLNRLDLGEFCRIVANNLDEYYREENE